ncbi:4-hydroxy-tetrahydrodipicolinate synthase [Kushneria avicenniae]|uniref:4-hydroxy-tetrahydrodipicolinate synthase n=1 Tax=Kushneria avicenniae TaxID=402385 RepID=A0A1I1M333_9GAMM|nr:4-hydroxy-tetrahydrodipicolinate synthase [Kushneria avicenniae]SFC76060.1 4-hydroxy-tetrahydrodipicolinate synthase [Kushneria avicenniae]
MTTSFAGIVPAMMTPMTEQEEIDEQGIRDLAETLISKGVHGLFTLGTNGEFFSLTDEEKVEVTRIVIDQAAGRVPVFAGTGGYTTRSVIELNRKMADIGVDGVSIITPYFNGATQAELITHYERISAATELPILLYTIPAKAGVTLDVASVAHLSKISNIRAIKDSGGDFDRLVQLIRLRREDFAVFTGTDSMILWTLMAGGDGAVAATTNAVPDVVMAIWHAFQKGDFETARDAQERLRPLRNAFSLGTMPSVLKTAAGLLGMPAGPARSPVQPLPPEKLATLREALKGYDRVER